MRRWCVEPAGSICCRPFHSVVPPLFLAAGPAYPAPAALPPEALPLPRSTSVPNARWWERRPTHPPQPTEQPLPVVGKFSPPSRAFRRRQRRPSPAAGHLVAIRCTTVAPRPPWWQARRRLLHSSLLPSAVACPRCCRRSHGVR
jgi:hypothetical protein